VLGCFVSAANVADIKAAPVIWLWALERFSRISKILGDKGYRSRAKAEQLKKGYDCEVEISLRHEQGFEVEPKRWIVERTLAWLDNARALCRDYEGLPENHEGMVFVAMIRLMLRRLCRNRRTRDLTKQQKRESQMLN
jgi:putative transposase